MDGGGEPLGESALQIQAGPTQATEARGAGRAERAAERAERTWGQGSGEAGERN